MSADLTQEQIARLLAWRNQPRSEHVDEVTLKSSELEALIDMALRACAVEEANKKLERQNIELHACIESLSRDLAKAQAARQSEPGRAARDAVLEEAAQVCDRSGMYNAYQCAERIRALKSASRGSDAP